MTPYCQFNCASLGGPESPEKPCVPFPATVAIVPSGETLRMRWLLVSAINASPPSPEYPGLEFPAIRVRMPSVSRLKMPFRSVLAKYRFPAGSVAILMGVPIAASSPRIAAGTGGPPA